MMEIDDKDKALYVIPYSSFIAGLLLAKKNVSALEAELIKADFMNKMDIYFEYNAVDKNMEFISPLVSLGHNFELLKDYDDIIKLDDGKEITVYDYLYKYTHVFVKTYFALPDEYKPEYKWEMDASTKKRRS